jgi:hypothetical protein
MQTTIKHVPNNSKLHGKELVPKPLLNVKALNSSIDPSTGKYYTD